MKVAIQGPRPTVSRGKWCHSQPHMNTRLELQMQFDRGNPELSSLFCLPNFTTMAQMLSFVTLQLHVFISLSLKMTLTNHCSIVPRSQAPLRIEIFILVKDDRMHTEHLTVDLTVDILVRTAETQLKIIVPPTGIIYIYQQSRSKHTPTSTQH